MGICEASQEIVHVPDKWQQTSKRNQHDTPEDAAKNKAWLD